MGKCNKQGHELSCGTLLLAPHCDDVAFAVGGHLLRCALPAPVTVATVFSRSNYTLTRRFRNHADDVTAIRKSEEREFLNSVGAQWVDCDLPEASLRGYSTFGELFGALKYCDSIPDELNVILLEIISSKSCGVIGIPLGLGHHVDHLIVRDVSKVLLGGQGAQVFFYEELPYASKCADAEINNLVNALMPGAVPHLCDISTVLEEKVQALSNFRSQVGPEELNAVRSYATRVNSAGGVRAFERTWMSQLP
jgi:LmbE family N-acetylglucosaminyl deacetylase